MKAKRPPSLYERIIREATKQTDAGVLRAVESIMRTKYGTLDNIDRPTFLYEARIALEAYNLMDAALQKSCREDG